MYISTLPYVIYRSYSDFGYLTDNRNFGYDTASKSCLKLGDIILSETGNVFYSVLQDIPLSADDLVLKLSKSFPDVPKSVLLEDAKEFYSELAERGFIYCGESDRSNSIKTEVFSYANMNSYELAMQNYTFQQDVYERTFRNENRLTRVHLDISSKCNENCVHCYIPKEKKLGIMSEYVFDTILEQCIKMNVLNITISGGEPMLNPLFKSFLIKCKKYNFSVNILSNLTMLSQDILEIIADNPLVCVQTSLYSMDPIIHDAITGFKGSCKKTISAIKALHKRNIPMQINCPIMRQNLHCYKDVLEFASSLNIESDADYTLYGCYDFSSTNLGCRLSTEEVKTVINDSQHRTQTGNVTGRSLDDPICSVCKHSLCFSNNGDVYPCEGWQSLVIGNILKKSLRSLWEEEPLTLHLRSLKYRDFHKCSLCDCIDKCNPCLVMNANEDSLGNYYNVNPFVCEISRLKNK